MKESSGRSWLITSSGERKVSISEEGDMRIGFLILRGQPLLARDMLKWHRPILILLLVFHALTMAPRMFVRLVKWIVA